MIWTVSNVRRAFTGRLIGNSRMVKVVCETLLYLPDEIIEYVTRNVWFISSAEDAWAFTFRGSDIRKQHLIVISDELLAQNVDDMRYTILHEIGHVMLGHKNSMGFEQTSAEVKLQEKEADKFAKKYLSSLLRARKF